MINNIKVALQGLASKPVVIKARLTGPASDSWRSLQEAAMGLELGDAELVALLLWHSGTSLRKALRDAPRMEE